MDNGLKIDDNDLRAAADAGFIDARQIEPLSAFLRQRRESPLARDENFRIASNFGDVFIVIGQIIFAIAAFSLIAYVLRDNLILGMTTLGAVFWLMGELFVFKRPRLAPAIVSSVLFAACAAVIAPTILPPYTSHYGTGFDAFPLFKDESHWRVPLGWAFGFLLTFARFRIPFLLFTAAAATSITVVAIVSALAPQVSLFWPIFLAGATCLTIAIWLDIQDRLRRTIKSACAFWLYIVGAPLTIHSFFLNFLSANKESILLYPANLSITVCLIALMVSLVGIALDRRSLISPSIAYVTGILIYWGSSSPLVMLIIPVMVGFAIIVLGTYWYPIRARIFRPFAETALFKRLPPIVAS